MIRIDLKPGDELRIGTTTVRIVKKSGQQATLVIDAEATTPVSHVKEGVPAIPAAKAALN